MNNEFDKFLVDPRVVEPKQFAEVPPSPPPMIISKAPSGYAPMSQIELEGQAYSGVTSGTIPWWVLISAAVVFVVPGLAMALASGNVIALLIPVLPLAIVLRGVRAKLISQKHKKQRRSRREIAMRE